MFSFEKKAIVWLQTHILWFALLTGVLLSFAIRLYFLPYHSGDFDGCLNPWFEQIKAAGGLGALSQPIGNYNILYLTLIALLTYLPLDPLVSIKMLSILFDYIGAAAAAALVMQLSLTDRQLRGLITFLALIFSPTVLLNSAMWAQCDFMYTTFLLLCLLSLVRERYFWAILHFSLALCLKLQAIFFLPVLLLLYLVKKRFSLLYFLQIPLVLLLSGLPALIAGRPLQSILSIYHEQIEAYPQLTLAYPNLFALLHGDYQIFAGPGILLTFFLIGLLALVILYRRIRPTGRQIIALSLWTVLICVFFLPAMHERYAFFADVLSILYALLYRRRWHVALGVNLVSLLSYTPFLLGYTVVELPLLALANLGLLALLTRHLTKELSLFPAHALG